MLPQTANKPAWLVYVTGSIGALAVAGLLISIIGHINSKSSSTGGGIGYSSSGSSRARDAQRKADLRSVKNALETYYNDQDPGSYPSGDYSGLSKVLVSGYLPSLPQDPLPPRKYSYKPSPDGCTNDCTSFALTATLENKNDESATDSNGTYEIDSIN